MSAVLLCSLAVLLVVGLLDLDGRGGALEEEEEEKMAESTGLCASQVSSMFLITSPQRSLVRMSDIPFALCHIPRLSGSTTAIRDHLTGLLESTPHTWCTASQFRCVHQPPHSLLGREKPGDERHLESRSSGSSRSPTCPWQAQHFAACCDPRFAGTMYPAPVMVK